MMLERSIRRLAVFVAVVVVASGGVYAAGTGSQQTTTPGQQSTPTNTTTTTENPSLTKQDVLRILNQSANRVSQQDVDHVVSWLGDIQNVQKLDTNDAKKALSWMDKVRESDRLSLPESAGDVRALLGQFAGDGTTTKTPTTETPTTTTSSSTRSTNKSQCEYHINDATCIVSHRWQDNTVHITVQSKVPQRVTLTDASKADAVDGGVYNIPVKTVSIPSGTTTVTMTATPADDGTVAVNVGIGDRLTGLENEGSGAISILPDNGSDGLALVIGLLTPPGLAVLISKYRERQRRSSVRRVTDT